MPGSSLGGPALWHRLSPQRIWCLRPSVIRQRPSIGWPFVPPDQKLCASLQCARVARSWFWPVSAGLALAWLDQTRWITPSEATLAAHTMRPTNRTPSSPTGSARSVPAAPGPKSMVPRSRPCGFHRGRFRASARRAHQEFHHPMRHHRFQRLASRRSKRL